MHAAPPAPRAAITSSTPGRLVAWWVLIAAVLVVLGVYLPFLTRDGESGALSDGGFDVVVVFLLPAVAAAVAAAVTLSGHPVGAVIGAGAMGGGAGYAITVLTTTWWALEEFRDVFGGDTSYGVGFFALMAGTFAALVALVAGLSASRDAVRGSAPHPLFASLAGLAFVGVPLSLLLPENGVSIWDFPDNAVKASVIAWAVLAPLVGFAAALGRTRGGVFLALGVAVGHLGLVVSLARNDFDFAVETSGPVMREPLFVAAVVAALVLCLLALALAPANLTPTQALAVEHAPPPAGVAAPPPVVDLAATPVAGRWDEDPYGRHQMRWFDGHRWTDRVLDDLVESADQPGWASSGGPTLPS